MKHLTLYGILFLAFSIASCGSGSRRDISLPVGEIIRDKDVTRELISNIEAFNRQAPKEFRTELDIIGSLGEQKFRFSGQMAYRHEPRAMNLFLVDFIFRNPMSLFYQNEEIINYYFPQQKRVYVYTDTGMNLSEHFPLSAPFDYVYDIIRGRFPLINNYSLRGYTRSQSSSTTLLVLENKHYFQTIALKEGLVEKTLLIDKQSKNRFECYYLKIARKSGHRMPVNIRVVDNGTTLTMMIRARNLIIRENIMIRSLKIPDGVDVIKR